MCRHLSRELQPPPRPPTTFCCSQDTFADHKGSSVDGQSFCITSKLDFIMQDFVISKRCVKGLVLFSTDGASDHPKDLDQYGLDVHLLIVKVSSQRQTLDAKTPRS